MAHQWTAAVLLELMCCLFKKILKYVFPPFVLEILSDRYVKYNKMGNLNSVKLSRSNHRSSSVSIVDLNEYSTWWLYEDYMDQSRCNGMNSLHLLRRLQFTDGVRRDGRQVPESCASRNPKCRLRRSQRHTPSSRTTRNRWRAVSTCES